MKLAQSVVVYDVLLQLVVSLCKAITVVTTITALGGLLGLVVSLGLLTWQTRAVASQTKISNALAGTTALAESAAALREIITLFIDRPDLRPYFYDGKALPRREAQRNRVLSVAEIFADTLEDGLVVTRLVPAAESQDDWIGYCRDMLGSSPALAKSVRSHPHWWPQLIHMLDSQT
jgi:hypothetical protein